MNKLSFFLLSTYLAVARSSVHGNELPSIASRHLLRDSRCTLVKQCSTYGSTDEHPNGYNDAQWFCHFEQIESERLGFEAVRIMESSSVAVIANATSGKSTLSVSEAIIDTDSSKMYVPEYARVDIREDRDNVFKRGIHSRQIPRKTGVLKALVIRLIAGNGVEPSSSKAELENAIFGNNLSARTQMKACSYGKLKIEPFKGTTPNGIRVDNGVVDVKVNYVWNEKNKDNFWKLVDAAIKEKLGNTKDEMFDLVMRVYPPEEALSEKFIAGAGVNNENSYFYDDHIIDVSVQMHEIGHNLGLQHSGEIEDGKFDKYGDLTGYMGYKQNDSKMCYNPQKSYQLGWYEDKVKTIDPLGGDEKRRYTLNGVSDYKENKNALVVLHLEHACRTDRNHYIGFNRATGINSDVAEDANKVTIVFKENKAAEEDGITLKVASLKEGEEHALEDFNGDVLVKFSSLENGGQDAKITIINTNPSASRCNNPIMPTPVPAPTSRPVPPPTRPPLTQKPSSTTRPTKRPTSTQRPTTKQNPTCKDEVKKVKVKESSTRKLSCKQLAKKKKCDSKISAPTHKGKYIWEVCKKSCNRC